mmetsp:Transcript_17111/g.48900  ORF Transcript_17111/g.48900 Transcript_17111/m.48900 type:complete len:211 (-) Transcript_17111:1970-2602(-)
MTYTQRRGDAGTHTTAVPIRSGGHATRAIAGNGVRWQALLRGARRPARVERRRGRLHVASTRLGFLLLRPAGEPRQTRARTVRSSFGRAQHLLWCGRGRMRGWPGRQANPHDHSPIKRCATFDPDSPRSETKRGRGSVEECGRSAASVDRRHARGDARKQLGHTRARRCRRRQDPAQGEVPAQLAGFSPSTPKSLPLRPVVASRSSLETL